MHHFKEIVILNLNMTLFFNLGISITPIPGLTAGYTKISKNGESIKSYLVK